MEILTNVEDRTDIRVLFDNLQNECQLTKKELQILKVLAFKGLNNQELGKYFAISDKTVKNHINNIFRKTNTKSSRELQGVILRLVLSKMNEISTMYVMSQTINRPLLK